MAPEPVERRCRLIEQFRRIRSAEVPRAGAVAGLIRVCGRLAVLLLQLFLARVIVDQDAFGLYAWGQNLLFLLGGVFALGIPVAASRLVAVQAHHGNGPLQQAVIRRARWLLAVFSGALALCGLMLLWSLPVATAPGVSREIAVIAVLAAPLVSFTLLYQAIGRAQSQLFAAFVPTQVLRPVLAGMLAFSILLSTGANLSASQALAAVVGSLGLVLVIQSWLTRRPRRTTAGGQAGMVSDEYAPRRLMANALPIFATRLSELVMRHSGVLALGLAATPAMVGGFFVAERLAHLVALPMLVVGAVIQPWLASAHAAGDRVRLQKVVTQAVHTTLWPALVGVIVLHAASGLLLGLFGEGFRDGAPILLVLMLAHLAAALFGPNQQILIMSGHQATAFRISAVAAIVHLCLLGALVPFVGSLGAAVATLVSTLAASAAALRAVHGRLGLKSSILLGAGIGPATRKGAGQ